MTARRLPADFAPVRPKTKPTGGSEPSLGPVLPVSEDVRWDARRAITKASEKGAWTTSESGQAFDMLGLMPERELTGPASIACSTCGAAAGVTCRAVGSRKLLVHGYHRSRKAEALA